MPAWHGDDAGTWYVGEEKHTVCLCGEIKSTSRLRVDNPVRPDPTHDRSVFTVLSIYMRVKIANTCVIGYGGVFGA